MLSNSLQKASTTRAMLLQKHRDNNENASQNLPHKSMGRKDKPSGQFQLEDFQLGPKLGSGLFGHVYKARTLIDAASGQMKVVALKTVFKSSLEEENDFVQLKREVEIHTRLRHENILRMYSYFHDPKHVFMILEFCAGGDLRRHLCNLSDTGGVSESQMQPWLTQVAKALKFCHSYQVYHRDVKPENILLCGTPHNPTSTVKLADFGWSTMYTHGTEERSHTMCGTVDYLAPEMVEGRPYHAQWVDSWMFGVLLFDVATDGKLTPFTGRTRVEQFDRIAKCQVAWQRLERKQVSTSLTRLISNLLRPVPEDRFVMDDVLKHAWIEDLALSNLV